MDKGAFKKLALLGLASGFVISTEARAENSDYSSLLEDSKNLYISVANTPKQDCGANWCASTSKLLADDYKKTADNASLNLDKDKSKVDLNAENTSYHLLTEDELLLQLNDEGIKQYNSLSPEGKKLALKVASAMCQGTNECKGLNACKTDQNDCAGKGKCKGQGKCSISDKNLAVKLVAKKMAEKRAGAASP